MKTHNLTTSPDLLAILETAKAHNAPAEEIEAHRRAWVIGELMRDDPALTREAAEALYDEAHTEVERPSLTVTLSEETVSFYQKIAASPLGMGAVWKVGGEGGKPLLYGCRSLLAYGTIGTWDEFRMIAALVNDMTGKIPEAHYDDLAVDRFAGFMKRKLAAKRADGYGGWQDPEQCSIEVLSRLLVEHVLKGDPLDVAILAMMIHHRQGRIITRPEEGQ